MVVLFYAHPAFARQDSTRIEFMPPVHPENAEGSVKNLEEHSPNPLQETSRFPDPKMVMKRSLMLPGWGQVTNKQAWKVPLVYGLLGGLSYYSVSLTKDYHDYRAAYYNAASGNNDFRFGPTPDYLVGANTASLKNNRDYLRNRRDFIYITIGLAYLLNAVDAYVFAHLRSFDVSDDLTLNSALKPGTMWAQGVGEVPSITLSITLSR